MPGQGQNWPSYKATARTGAQRVVAAELPLDHARALRAYCARKGVPIQSVLKALVADWVILKEGLKDQPSPAAPQQSPVAVIPARAQPRADTGRSEPATVLQQIDTARVAAQADGKSFED